MCWSMTTSCGASASATESGEPMLAATAASIGAATLALAAIAPSTGAARLALASVVVPVGSTVVPVGSVVVPVGSTVAPVGSAVVPGAPPVVGLLSWVTVACCGAVASALPVMPWSMVPCWSAYPTASAPGLSTLAA